MAAVLSRAKHAGRRSAAVGLAINLTEEFAEQALPETLRAVQEDSGVKSRTSSRKGRATAVEALPLAEMHEDQDVIHYIAHEMYEGRFAEAELKKLRPESLETLSATAVSASDASSGLLPKFARSRLLLPEEERYLFLWMNYGLFRAEALRKRLVKLPRNHALWRELAQWKRQAMVARNQIIQANLRLIVALARKLSKSVDQLPELVSEGVMPLIRSVELFDIGLGNRFSTYATWAVRNQMLRCLKKSKGFHHWGACPSEGYLEQVEDYRGPTTASQIETQSLIQREIVSLLDNFTERERIVVTARYGLDGIHEGQSLQEISERVGLSKERVRQIILKVLGQLKISCEKNPAILDACAV